MAAQTEDSAAAAASIIAQGHAVLDVPDASVDFPFYRLWSSFLDEAGDGFRRYGSGMAGYHGWGSERAVGAQGADRKEFFHFMEGTRLPPALDGPTRELFHVLARSAHDVLAEIEASLAKATRLVPLFSSTARAVMRVTRYEAGGEVREDGAAAHTDIDLLTLLPAATGPGLAVSGRDGWTPLVAERGRVIVLAGDMLEVATGGVVRAARHKVASLGERRLSVSFFANPPDEALVADGVTAKDLFDRRMLEMAGSEEGGRSGSSNLSDWVTGGHPLAGNS